MFRDGYGRELTTDDLAKGTGRVQWELIGAEQVHPLAEQLHREGRSAGANGEYARAMALFDGARVLAPKWPYPVYDAAFTCLLAGDTARARELYAEVDRMAPRGFFTAKTSLHALNRELAGELPAGFCRAFALLDSEDDRAEKRAALADIVAHHPDFAPAWKDLGSLLDDETERERAVERGLAAKSDAETRGILLINKALTLHRRGDLLAAVEILGTAALDPESTLVTEMLAKAALAQLHRQGGLPD